MRLLACLAVLLFFAAPAFAGFRLPPSVFTGAEMEKVVEKARAEKRPITIMMSNVDTTCPLSANASGQMMQALRTSTVFVYVKSWDELPAGASALLRKADRGRYIPWSAVLDADFTKVLGLVTYEEVKAEGSRAFSDLRKAIAAYRAGAS